MVILRILIAKEWMRLKKNPAALMAAGLIVLMAILVSIENKASVKAKRLDNAPCLIVYQQEDALIQFFKQVNVPHVIRFQQTSVDLTHHSVDYPSDIRCAIEISPEYTADVSVLSSKPFLKQNTPSRNITLRAIDNKNERFQKISRWVLARVAEYQGGVLINEESKPIKNKAPTKTLGTIDLGSNSAKAMVGAMLLFSAQYFLACALFISFTAHERERGILQSLALTTASFRQLLWAKLLFHLGLAYVVSAIIFSIVNQSFYWVANPFTVVSISLVLLASALGLFSMATIMTCVNRTQTGASMMGFCYIMLMGVIFSLANKFSAFATIKAFMFESHAIAIFNWLFNRRELSSAAVMGHFVDLIVLSLILFFISRKLWEKKGWRTL